MIYRVDYVLLTIVAGVIIGAVLGWRLPTAPAARWARGYFVVTAALLAVRLGAWLVGTAAGGGNVWWNGVGGICRDLGGVLLGVALGLDTRRRPDGGVLRQPPLLAALCLTTGFGFVLAGLGKAFVLDDMLAFFAHAGYPAWFLKVIMMLEALAGVALVIPSPWTLLPALIGLGVDMFGAVYTHVHNGDPIHDSTGAIASLIRLGLIAALWLAQRRGARATGWRPPAALVGAGALACLAMAVAGAAAVRRLGARAAAAHAATAPAVDAADGLVGAWHCAGRFTRSGEAIEADLRFERVLGDGWLLFRHDDRPPHRFHALAEWRRGDEGWTATMQDSSGGLRLFHAAGWQDGRLVWEGGSLGEAAAQRQRFVFTRDGAGFRLGFSVVEPSGDWRLIDESRCTRAGS